MIPFKHVAALLLLCGLLLPTGPGTVRAGEGRLRRFERSARTRRDASGDATRDSAQASANKSSRISSEESSLTVDLIENLVIRPILYGMAAGGEYAYDLSNTRLPGHPMFPLMRLDVGTQYISEDIFALGYGFELGRGVLAADFRHTYYRERILEDTLHQFQYHVLYRMAAHRKTQLDLALGAMTLHGEDTQTAFSMGMPVRYWPSDSLGLELRPLWAFFPGGSLMDVEAGVLLRYEYTSVRLGYRWVEQGGESLSGPRIGISFRF